MKSKIIKFRTCLLFFFFAQIVQSKEIALSFDDSPTSSSKHFESVERTEELIKKLKALDVPEVMIFANPCKKKNSISQLKKFSDAGHLIANHTCNHPRLDEAGFEKFSKDAEQVDQLLAPLMSGQKYFRFPFLNESKDNILRDQMREWLKTNKYRNGMVSVDNDDYMFSWAINKAKDSGKKIDYKKVEALFLNHVLGAVDFYDGLAIKNLGYSPKHVLLLHEVDATVLFIDSLVKELRKKGWKIIQASEAYKDKLYLKQPINTYANNGIVAQVALDKTGEKVGYNHFEEVRAELVKILKLD